MIDAFFAGRVFALGEQDGFRFFLWGEASVAGKQAGEMSIIASYAEPADGAFLCKLESGWLFVAGAGARRQFRHTFFDCSPEADANAQAMHDLGIPILSISEGNERVRADGVALYSVTGDEKRRASA